MLGSIAPEQLMQEIAHQHLFNQFWLSVFFVIPMVLVARAVVAGTRYSAILIIVVFGLAMGYLMVATGVSEPGLSDFPMLGMVAQTTIVALTATFFVGGQELRRIFLGEEVLQDQSVSYATEQVFLGTGRTQVIFIARAFLMLLGIGAGTAVILDTVPDTSLGRYYPLIAYMGLVIAVILIDYKATIANTRTYLHKGVAEIIAIMAVLGAGYLIAVWVSPLIALPQIFFVMLIAAGVGALLYRWEHGPAVRCLLFAGIPVVLAANFIIGGSRIGEAFALSGMDAVMAYGFFGQVFWMFGGIALLVFFGRTAATWNLGPGMAGALSHAGLTGACTAGDLGETASRRAPIMINIPFFGHIFVFSILAVSMEQGRLLMVPSVIVAVLGLGLTLYALRNLASARGDDAREVKALMQFSFGWQLTAVFGGLLLLAVANMSVANAMMATSSAMSHFGLFAAIQGGMAGPESQALIAFIFAMPFLVHPLVFFMFGRAMENDGQMPRLAVYVLALIGAAGVGVSMVLSLGAA
ncbi:hypothetical protein [Mucisphaera calidilacus]|uniref:Uncharacterized protein n=1 Tax=Mucisphaera calidilacus TaxID=2527982 RepID=A0A518BVK7_9BACT|nr:hypothetical protein [Mucisphaera calidilacus]QDU71015.1 hypothetical protein Pan265_08600 [Mucisphaera calidilacus]